MVGASAAHLLANTPQFWLLVVEEDKG